MSAEMAPAGVSCPSCGHAFTLRDQRRMNTLLGAAKPTACPGCNSQVRWHHTLHRRMLIGGLLFRVGVLALVAAITAPLFFKSLPFAQTSVCCAETIIR